jgi:murein DD-endopeptidase MepM/ murein hydrolase activator NlpD
VPSFSDVYAAVKLDLDASEELKLKRRIEKIDTKTAGRKMGMGMSKSLGGGFRAGIGGAARTMFAPIVAAAAAVGTFQLFKGFIEDAQESAKISRITTQVIKSTGGAAKVTAMDVDALSEALSNKTAVDDELVQTGANLLLTFKNVRNEAGKGNDIFNRATEAALDLSAAGFGSVDSAAKMLGKALNDPIAGLTALKRAGVTFTDAQKEQIKTLVESGDILTAQGIIMDEVATQVGGAAEAAAGPMDKLKTIAVNLGEQIGTLLLPYLEDFADWLVAEGVPKIQRMIGTFRDEWIPVIQDLVRSFREDWWPAIKEVWGFVVDVFETAWPIIEEIYRRINTAGERWMERLQVYLDIVDGVWDGIKTAFAEGVRAVANFMIGFAEVILDGAEAAFGWVEGIGPKLREAQGKLEQFKTDVNSTLDKITDEEIVIRVSSDANEAIRFANRAAALGGGGGRGGGGLPSMRAFTPDDAVGGAMDWRATGLDAARVGKLAAQIGKNASDHIVTALNRAQFMPGLGAMLGPGGFPLPRGRYRVGRGSVGHGYPAQDFPAVTGTPIYAVRSGVVSRALRSNAGYGIHALLAHAGGWGSLYGHMSQMFVRAGQAIRSGQMIGRVGSTGRSTGPHLHFEARRNGSLVNPRSLISYDQGGWLPRGLSLAYNGTGREERVLGPNDPMQVNIQLPDFYSRVPTLMPALRQVARIEVDEALRLREMAARRGGRS